MSGPKIPYDPIPSIGHEMGIMFGFGALMLVCMVAYYVGWKVYQKKVAAVEANRRADLAQTALYSDGFGEKRGLSEGMGELGEQ